MRFAVAAALLLTPLAGCASWDWREIGRAFVDSQCAAAGGCEEICRDAPRSDAARRRCP